MDWSAPGTNVNMFFRKARVLDCKRVLEREVEVVEEMEEAEVCILIKAWLVGLQKWD